MYRSSDGHLFVGGGYLVPSIQEFDAAGVLIQTYNVARGVETMALDPVTHRVYLATAKFDENAKDERGRPKIIDGTFRVLIYSSER